MVGCRYAGQRIHAHRGWCHGVHGVREIAARICRRRRFLVNGAELVFFHFELFFAVSLLFTFRAALMGAAMSMMMISTWVLLAQADQTYCARLSDREKALLQCGQT